MQKDNAGSTIAQNENSAPIMSAELFVKIILYHTGIRALQ
jgi:hypothetical protein